MPIQLPQSLKLRHVVLGLIVLVGIIYLGRSCRLGEKIASLKEQVAIQDKVISNLKEEYAKSQALVKEKEGVIREKDAEIEAAEKKIIASSTTIATQGHAIRDLEDELAGLTDKDEIIRNLKAQIEGWKKQFTLCQEIIAQKDAIIFSLTQKYDAEHAIRINLQATLDKAMVEMQTMIDRQKALTDALEAKAKSLSLKGRVSNIIAVAAVVAAVLLGVK